MLLEAFSIQLVILAILKQSLHICHAQAVVAADESPSFETIKSPQNSKASHSVSSEIEKEFLLSVEHAEELAKDVGQVDGIKPPFILLSSKENSALHAPYIICYLLAEAAHMPDAIELIFQSALAFGRRGAVSGNSSYAYYLYGFVWVKQFF